MQTIHNRCTIQRDLGKLHGILTDLVSGNRYFPFTAQERETYDMLVSRARERIDLLKVHLVSGDLPLHRIEGLMRKAISAVNDLDIFLVQVWEADQDELITESEAEAWYEDPAEVEARRPR